MSEECVKDNILITYLDTDRILIPDVKGVLAT